MILAIIYLAWCAFAILEGKREALYYSFKMKSSIVDQKTYERNEHPMFAAQRALVLILCFLSLEQENILDQIVETVCLMFAFPFLHDGMYYLQRHRTDRLYPKKWFDQSTTSTALSDKLNLFTPFVRTALFGVSIAAITLIIFLP